MQHCTRTRVLGYHSTSAQTRSGVSLMGSNSGLKSSSKDNSSEQLDKLRKNDNKGTYCYRLKAPSNWHVMKQMDLLPRWLAQITGRRRGDYQSLQTVLMTQH